MITEFDIEINFWETHPDFKAAGPIGKLYKNDKTKKKDKTSSLMWTVALIWDMSSKYYNLPEDGEDSKIPLLFEEVYGDKEWYLKNQSLVFDLKMQYLKMQDTIAMRALRDIEQKIDERSRFLANTPYDLGICNERGSWVGNTATIVDKMMADTKKIYDLLEAAKKVVSEELASGETKGGGRVSLSDNETI